MATITSAKAGLWSDPTTWTGGVLPAASDQVDIAHSITYDLNDETTLYGRININANGAIIHDNTIQTAIASTRYIHVNGGTYQAGPMSKTLFKSTSKSSGTEGTGLAGIYAQGGVTNTKLILEGSVPLPETSLTTAVSLGDTVLTVSDASGFAEGEYIAVYRDISGDTSWGWNGTNQSDEGFIIHHIDGNDIHIQQRVAIMDTINEAMPIGQNWVSVNSIKKWQPGFKIWIDDELFTIDRVNEDTGNLALTTVSTVAHSSGAKIIETGAQKVHAVGDKVYKIATVTTANTSTSATTIAVANAAMLEIGDRVGIEGVSRNNAFTTSHGHEAIITAKTGNTLTLDTAIPYATSIGFIVTKTSRDCVVSSTDTADANRTWIYYLYGGSTVTGRKCVLRYMELSHIGNSASGTYAGLVLRSDFNRSDLEREVRGCVVRDGWGLDRCGIWNYSGHYLHYRNNVTFKCYNGLQPYDNNGSSFYNNISIGNSLSGYRYEGTYYYNQFQYNIATNSQYPVLGYSDYNAIYPEWHNLFRHHERGLHFTNGSIGSQYGSWMKNRYEDIQWEHNLVEGTRIVVQDIEITPGSGSNFSNWASSYSNYDERGLNGGMLVIVNKNFVRGDFEMYSAGGRIFRDRDSHMGNGWSYKYQCNHGSIDLRISQMVYVKYGVPVKAVAYMKKNAAYNGSRRPYIMARGLYLGEYFSYMENVNDQWVRVTLEFTPQRSEMIQIGVGARGTAGFAWIDPRVSVTTHDLDLINGPYSVNLMFGLEPYSDNPGGVVLGGGMTL